jgi:hypothetical protein
VAAVFGFDPGLVRATSLRNGPCERLVH